jgi:small redox-active disulfide protein 2
LHDEDGFTAAPDRIAGRIAPRSAINPPGWEWNEDRRMKTLQILGTGCPKCKALAENTEAAAKNLGMEYRMEKITDIQAIMGFGVMMMPALAVNGVVKVWGKVPSMEEIRKILSV